MENIESFFTSEIYDTSILDEGEDQIFEINKLKIILTTSSNQKSWSNKNNNITSIELGQCETFLKQYYNISEEKVLYIKKLEIIQEGMKIPKIEYSVYYNLNETKLEKLNIAICKDTSISLILPLEINENLDELNKSSGYYNDICYPATSESGTDILLKDRKKEFIEKNKTVCQDDCVFSGYNYTTKKVNCFCEVNEMPLSFLYMKINKTKLYQNIFDIKNVANIKILICYKLLLTVNGILYNIGSYILLAIILFHIVSIIIFYLKQFNGIKSKIKNIIFAIKNLGKTKNKNKKKKKKKDKKDKKNKNKSENINNNSNKNIETNQLNNDLKEEKEKNNQENIKNSPNKKIESNQINNNLKEKNNQENKIVKSLKIKVNKNKKNKNIKSKIKTTKNNKNLSISSINRITTFADSTKPRINNIKTKEEIKSILVFSDEEKNLLLYELAKKYDKRTFCVYYLSLIKTKHNLFFSFFRTNDYNSQIIKIDIFFVGFAIYYTVNALFFDDKTMHKIYETKGSFNIEYQLPKLVYSSLISSFLNSLLKFLALTDKGIIELKGNKSKNNIDMKKRNLEKIFNIKFIVYFVISFLFLLCFWYYVAIFGAVYKNTQIILLVDTLISFELSLIYPFAIYLLPSTFRIISLSNPAKKREWLYNFSKLLQLF